MRFLLALSMLSLASVGHTTTILHGTVDPIFGVNLQLAGDYRPGTTKVSIDLKGTTFQGVGSSYLISTYSYSIFNEYGGDVGNDIEKQDFCDTAGSQISCGGLPDPITGAPNPPNWMRDISFTPTRFSYTVTRPANHDDCHGQIGVVCAEFWGFSDGFFFPVASRGSYTLSYTAVPEPASWALLIAGFGLVGAAMRRRGQHGRSHVGLGAA